MFPVCNFCGRLYRIAPRFSNECSLIVLSPCPRILISNFFSISFCQFLAISSSFLVSLTYLRSVFIPHFSCNTHRLIRTQVAPKKSGAFRGAGTFIIRSGWVRATDRQTAMELYIQRDTPADRKLCPLTCNT